MNNTITLTECQMQQLQAGESITIEPPKVKPTQWEPKGGSYWIDSTGYVGHVLLAGSVEEYKRFGTERDSETQAEKAIKAIRIHNRLLTYVDEFDPNYNPDWANPYENKYYVYYDHNSGKWSYSQFYSRCAIGIVYMSKECAKALVTKLNSGEVVL